MLLLFVFVVVSPSSRMAWSHLCNLCFSHLINRKRNKAKERNRERVGEIEKRFKIDQAQVCQALSHTPEFDLAILRGRHDLAAVVLEYELVDTIWMRLVLALVVAKIRLLFKSSGSQNGGKRNERNESRSSYDVFAILQIEIVDIAIAAACKELFVNLRRRR